jgi:hypothetical protein
VHKEARPTPSEASPAVSAGPVGQGDRVVGEGESIDSIAFELGFFPDTIWNHPANAELRRARPNRNELLAGDRVTVPPKRTKYEQVATGRLHTFQRRGVPAVLRLQLLRDGQPRANLAYSLSIDGETFTGRTDEHGRIAHWIPPSSVSGTLEVDGEETVYSLSFGTLQPRTEVRGLQRRLRNLGYPCGDGGELDEQTRAALREFQRHCGIEVTGEHDEATRRALDALHQG